MKIDKEVCEILAIAGLMYLDIKIFGYVRAVTFKNFMEYPGVSYEVKIQMLKVLKKK